jgi:AraC family transcriptional regulator
LGAGSCFLYAPGMCWAMEATGGEVIRKHFVLFDGRGVSALLRASGMRGGDCFELEALATTTALYEAVRREAMRRNERRAAVCLALLKALLLQAGASRRKEDGDSLPHRRFEKILELMEMDFLELRTAEEVAQRADVEVSYLCRLFKRYHDSSPYRHLQRLKMNHALALLAKPGMTVNRVADLLGYESPFHFSRVFKSVHGLPPKHFRG